MWWYGFKFLWLDCVQHDKNNLNKCNFKSPVCCRMCTFIDDVVANNPLHSGHAARFILPKWVIKWYSSDDLVANALLQLSFSHLYGLSPVCVLSCLLRSAFFLNTFSQNWHFVCDFCALISKKHYNSKIVINTAPFIAYHINVHVHNISRNIRQV